MTVGSVVFDACVVVSGVIDEMMGGKPRDGTGSGEGKGVI